MKYKLEHFQSGSDTPILASTNFILQQLVEYTLPAYELRAGDVLHVCFSVFVNVLIGQTTLPPLLVELATGESIGDGTDMNEMYVFQNPFEDTPDPEVLAQHGYAGRLVFDCRFFVKDGVLPKSSFLGFSSVVPQMSTIDAQRTLHLYNTGGGGSIALNKPLKIGVLVTFNNQDETSTCQMVLDYLSVERLRR